MTEFSEIARNKNRFRAACKDFSVEQLETMAAQLSEFIEKRTQEEVDMAEKNAKKDAEKQAIFAAIAEAGLTPADFFQTKHLRLIKQRTLASQWRPNTALLTHRVSSTNGLVEDALPRPLITILTTVVVKTAVVFSGFS